MINRHLTTILAVLALAIATTGAMALGSHDSVELPPASAQQGQDVSEAALAQDEATPTAEDNHGAAVTEFIETTATTLEGCERGLAIAGFASSHGNDGESRVADEAHDNCDADQEETTATVQDTATIQDNGQGEEFGRTTAEDNRGDAGTAEQGEAGDEQDDARSDGEQFGSNAAQDGEGNADRADDADDRGGR